VSVFDGMDVLALRTTAKMQLHLLSVRSNRIDELEHALNAAIGHIEMLMGSDADESEDVEWLQNILNKEYEV
jgi:hypothetical protein